MRCSARHRRGRRRKRSPGRTALLRSRNRMRCSARHRRRRRLKRSPGRTALGHRCRRRRRRTTGRSPMSTHKHTRSRRRRHCWCGGTRDPTSSGSGRHSRRIAGPGTTTPRRRSRGRSTQTPCIPAPDTAGVLATGLSIARRGPPPSRDPRVVHLSRALATHATLLTRARASE